MKEKETVLNEFSKIAIILVFTILALGEAAYHIGKYLNC